MKNISKNVVVTIIALVLVFVLDIFLPLGIAEGVLYILCFLFITGESKKTILIFSIITSILILFKLEIFYSNTSSWMVFANRFISVVAVLIATKMALKYRNLLDRTNSEKIEQIQVLSEKNEELNRLNMAIDKYLLFTISDLNGNILYANNKFCEITKYSREELIGKNHRIINSEHHSQEFWKELWDAVKREEPWHNEVKNKAKDGSYFWVDSYAFPIFNKEGKLIEYFCSRVLIDDKKKYEFALSETASLNHGILESITSAILVIDHNGFIITTNNGWNEHLEKRAPKVLKKAVVGTNYIEVLDEMVRIGNINAKRALNGLRAVLNKDKQIFEMDFSIGEPEIKYWLKYSVTSFKGTNNYAVIRTADITDRKSTEFELEKSKKKYKNLLDNMNDAFLYSELDGTIKFVNQKFYQIFNINEIDLPNFKFENIVALEYLDAFLERRKRRINGEIVDGIFEFEAVLNNNKRIWVEVNSKTIIKDGSIVGTEAIVRDITEKRNVEITLKNNKIRLKQAQKIAQMGGWEVDLTTGVTYLSDELLYIYGLTPDDRSNFNDNLESFVHPDDLEYVKHITEQNLKTFKNYSLIYRIIREDAVICYLNTSAQFEFDVYNKPKRLFGISQNITYIKEKEIELQRLADLNSKIIDSSDELFYIAKYDSKLLSSNNLIYINDKAKDFFGVEPELFIKSNMQWIRAIHKEDKKRFIEITRELIETKKPVARVYRILNIKFNEYIYVYDYIKPVLNNKNEIIEFYGSLKNITDLKNGELELVKTSQELSNRYNEMMQFNYIVSHNLRAPIANILGMASIINMDGLSMEEIRLCNEHINTATLKLDEVVHDLNLILETRSALNKSIVKVSIPQLLSTILGTIEKQLSESGTEVIINLDKNVEEINTIKGYLESILYNLISNTVKYKSPDRKPKVIISGKKENDVIKLSVSDNGLGINMNKHGERIFGLYNRFHLDVEGKGLGLYMCKTQIETLGGKIWVDSEVDKGTTFTLTLPIN